VTNTTGVSGQLPPELAEVLHAARVRRGWSYREAARRVGIGVGYMHALDHGHRRPSYSIALALADALALDPHTADDLIEQAVIDAGRDHPVRGMRNTTRRRRP
jgi:transcriptional regulator with XRE-family HTH domain